MIAPLEPSSLEHPRWLWRDGKLVEWEQATVHVTAAGHTGAASIFEGIRAYCDPERRRLLVFQLDQHLRRLYDSARICRLDLPFDIPVLRAAVLDLLRVNGYRDDTYLRIWAFPAGLIREQLVPAGARCEVVMDSWPVGSNLDRSTGCRAAVSSWLRPSDTSMPLRVKAFANYHNGRLAMMEARANGHDWPILLNDRLQVSEAPGACVALVTAGAVITPSLTSGVLPSITRSTVIAILDEVGIDVVEREVDRTELYLADEIFFMGTGWEILPVSMIDGLPVGNGGVGPVTDQVRGVYGEFVRGRDTRHPEWITEVYF